MQASLIRIGNSQGIRLPKLIIDQRGIERDLDMEVVDGALVLRPIRPVREGWAAAAEQCHTCKDDSLSDWNAITDDFDGDWA